MAKGDIARMKPDGGNLAVIMSHLGEFIIDIFSKKPKNVMVGAKLGTR